MHDIKGNKNMTDSFDEMRKIIKDLKSYRQDDLQVEKNLTNSNVSENENLSEDKPIEQEENYIDFENADNPEGGTEVSFTNMETDTKEDAPIEVCKICPNCSNKCNIEAIYCNKCGAKLEIERKCPTCGTDYTEDDIFCMKCGTKLQEQSTKIHSCPVCGTKYKDGSIFCGECGTNLKTNENTDFDNQTTTQHIQNTETNNKSQNTVKCPYCGSMIARYTKKCPHCGEWLSGSVSHFGCGSFLVLITTIIAICMAIGGESIGIPLVGEIGGIWLVIVAFLYFLPSLISDWRGHDSKFAIFIVNLLFGWTFIGWFVALIFSFTGRSR